MKHLKTLSLVALAVAALTAFVGVSSASAAQFLSSKSPVMLFGEQKTGANHTFKVDGQAVECNKAVFEKASLTTPANTVPGVNAAYSECTAFGFANATVNMGNCQYEFKQPNASLEGNVAVVCNGATNVNVNSSVFGSECSVSLNATGNGNLSKLTYANNNPAAGKVLVTAAVNVITVTKNKDNGLCPLSGTGTVTNGTYNGPTPTEGTEGTTISVA